MAQVLFDGLKRAIVKVHGAETIDVSTLIGAPAQVSIERLQYAMGAAVDGVISWDATADVVAFTPSQTGDMDFRCFGGLINNAGAGITGDIVIAGTGVFTIILHLVKP